MYFRGDFEEIHTFVYLISKNIILPITSSHRTSFLHWPHSVISKNCIPYIKTISRHPEVPRFQKNHVSICLISQVGAFNYSSFPYFRETKHSEVPHFKELHSLISKKNHFLISHKFMISIHLSSKNCMPLLQNKKCSLR